MEALTGSVPELTCQETTSSRVPLSRKQWSNIEEECMEMGGVAVGRRMEWYPGNAAEQR